MARSLVRLSMDERRVIARMHEMKISEAEIARPLRDHSRLPGTSATDSPLPLPLGGRSRGTRGWR
jgi:hypothetical protein